MRAAVSKRAANAQELPRSFVSSPPDTWLFIAVTSLVAIGLVMIFSASSAQATARKVFPVPAGPIENTRSYFLARSTYFF